MIFYGTRRTQLYHRHIASIVANVNVLTIQYLDGRPIQVIVGKNAQFV
jgi:hypothetical protein